VFIRPTQSHAVSTLPTSSPSASKSSQNTRMMTYPFQLDISTIHARFNLTHTHLRTPYIYFRTSHTRFGPTSSATSPLCYHSHFPFFRVERLFVHALPNLPFDNTRQPTTVRPTSAKAGQQRRTIATIADVGEHRPTKAMTRRQDAKRTTGIINVNFTCGDIRATSRSIYVLGNILQLFLIFCSQKRLLHFPDHTAHISAMPWQTTTTKRWDAVTQVSFFGIFLFISLTLI
jgi:hypothetical protein